MRTVNRSALVPYGSAEMFSLIADIEAYPEFLPWCSAATIHSANDDIVEASLTLRRQGYERTFRTRNLLQPNHRMDIELVEGPFKALDGRWLIEALGDEGCKVALTLRFEFSSRLGDILLGSFLESACNSLIDSFMQRANERHG